MRTRRMVLLCCCLVLGSCLAGCRSASGDSAPTVAVAEAGIAQTEAQGIFDNLAAATGASGFAAMASRRSQVESAALSLTDFRSVVVSNYGEYVTKREQADKPVEQYVPMTVGGFLSSVEASALPSSESLFKSGWSLGVEWRVYGGQQGETLKVQQMAGHEFLLDLLAPAVATTRTVSVEGTSIITVTFPDRTLGTWTETYRVEKRGDSWVIVAMPKAGDYWLAVSAHDQALRTAKPTDAELKRFLGKDKVLWMGQDKTGLWWMAAQRRLSMHGLTADEIYACTVHRDALSLKWVKSDLGAPDGAVQVDDSSDIPDEVIAAMKRDGVYVMDNRTQ
jgi:hypothetical protein